MRTLIAAVGLVLAMLAPVESLDVRARHAVQSMRTPVLERPMRVISDACNRGSLTTALLAVALIGGSGGVEIAREIVIVLIPVNLLVEATKRWTDRTRPDGEHRRSNSAFPSSHAANAFAIVLVLARRLRRFAVVFVFVAVVISFSRVYLDRHWLSDVIVGAAMGAAIAYFVTRALARRWPRAPSAPQGASMPGP